MAHWIVQANAAAWHQRAGQDVREWCVKRYRDRITPGDDLALWLTGGVGLAGVGRFTGVPYRWVDGTWHAPVDLVPLGTPVGRAELLSDPDFARSAILRMPGGANPFPVTDREWEAIRRRVPAARPPGRAADRSALHATGDEVEFPVALEEQEQREDRDDRQQRTGDHERVQRGL
ncbi:hypothetical protein J2S41_001846 [Catenuloplanes atrovinosus]|uniref:EVE domain-containing protein n=1 Tax=Catenuloplanes atrovinosus TaxID=137266 RepID=A0AAE4C8K2_9ACTN|nr:hypothetical protein [Catenuloplanes atrovinosus]